VLSALATLVLTLVVALAAVAAHRADGGDPSLDGACAEVLATASPDGSGGSTDGGGLDLADRTYDAFADLIGAVSDGETADLWRSVFATCEGGTFDPDGTPGPG
jgi:hypothetical protein